MERNPDRADLLARVGDGVRIAHWTRGRIRIGFDDPRIAAQFAKTAGCVQGVISAQANPLTGSVLIHYREGDGEISELLKDFAPEQRAPAARTPHRCPECRQAVRGESAAALPNLVKLTGSLLTGDVVGVVWWLISTSMDVASEPDFLPQPAYLQAA
jgi:hypothetical protein